MFYFIEKKRCLVGINSRAIASSKLCSGLQIVYISFFMLVLALTLYAANQERNKDNQDQLQDKKCHVRDEYELNAILRQCINCLVCTSPISFRRVISNVTALANKTFVRKILRTNGTTAIENFWKRFHQITVGYLNNEKHNVHHFKS